MQLTTQLGFDGNCREAFDYYAKVLGGKVVFRMTYGESPMANQYPEVKDRIVHSSLQVPGGGLLQGADAPPGRGSKHSGYCVTVGVKDAAEGKKIFEGLADGGQVKMPFDKTFWSEGFGMCVDKFGVPWMVNTEGPMPS